MQRTSKLREVTKTSSISAFPDFQSVVLYDAYWKEILYVIVNASTFVVQKPRLDPNLIRQKLTSLLNPLLAKCRILRAVRTGFENHDVSWIVCTLCLLHLAAE